MEISGSVATYGSMMSGDEFSYGHCRGCPSYQIGISPKRYPQIGMPLLKGNTNPTKSAPKSQNFKAAP